MNIWLLQRSYSESCREETRLPDDVLQAITILRKHSATLTGTGAVVLEHSSEQETVRHTTISNTQVSTVYDLNKTFQIYDCFDINIFAKI